MSVSDSYRTFVLEQIKRVAPRIRDKSMFGGVGIYSGDHFFALVDNDTLFFKVDDTNRADFVAARMKPWSPFGTKPMMGYFELPADLLEDPDAMKPWIDKAVAVAAKKKSAKQPVKKSPKKPAKKRAKKSAKAKGRRGR